MVEGDAQSDGFVVRDGRRVDAGTATGPGAHLELDSSSLPGKPACGNPMRLLEQSGPVISGHPASHRSAQRYALARPGLMRKNSGYGKITNMAISALIKG